MLPRVLLASLALFLTARATHAQSASLDWSRISHIVMPQTSPLTLQARDSQVVIERVSASVRIDDQVATTALTVEMKNPGARDAEAVFLLPVPSGAVVTTFQFLGCGTEMQAKVLPHDEARRLYDEIVARQKDPSLLEFAAFNVIRSSTFPVPARGVQRVLVVYEHVLEADRDRIDYVLPRSESLAVRTPWSIRVDVRSRERIADVYSPTHAIEVRHRDANHLDVSAAASEREPGPFLLSLLRERGLVSAALYAYPDPRIQGGYFLLVAALPPELHGERQARDVSLVIDRSGSMAGQKLDQAKNAALQILEGLQDGESFQIIDYATGVNAFAAQSTRKTPASMRAARDYLSALRSGGGTNIHDALLEMVRGEPCAGALPLALFLTDGLPTVGQTSEATIRTLVEQGNRHHRRVFAFGVGTDVNVPLLDRIADTTRARAVYVQPGEDLEVKVERVFRRLSAPVLADLDLDARDERTGARPIAEVIPAHLPDLFEGDQLIVCGQYRGTDQVTLRLSGSHRGARQSFDLPFDLHGATTRNAFVPRLWASRRIAFLADQVRALGDGRKDATRESRLRELTDEILELSTEFGILSEYTSFLATDGVSLGNWSALNETCSAQLTNLAIATRSGTAAVAQGCNYNDRKWQCLANARNEFVGTSGERVAFDQVQQICDRAFFAQAGRWIDAQLVTRRAGLEADRVVAIGSDAYRRLVSEIEREGRAGVLSLRGEILLEHHGERILVR